MLYSFENHSTETEDLSELPVAAPSGQHYPQTDEQLMRLLQEGDLGSLGILLYRHIAQSRTVIARILGDEAEAEKLSQQVFSEVSSQAHRYNEQCGPAQAWIMTLARRRAIDRLREKTTRTAIKENKRHTWADAPAVARAA